MSMDTTSLSGLGEHQLTPRAVLVGVFVGGLMCFSNMYFGLQTGWVTMGSLQSTILGYGVFKLLRPYLNDQFGPLENVVLQTVSVATATMPLAGGFVGIIPALAMLTAEQGGPITFDFGQLCWWSAAVAFFGVFAAVPLRRQTILREKLKFPSGTATAEIIKVLHGVSDAHQDSEVVARGISTVEMEPLVPTTPNPGSPEYLGPKRSVYAPTSSSQTSNGNHQDREVAAMEAHEWRVLFGSFSLSAMYTLAGHFLPILKNLPVMTWLGYPMATAWFWSLQPSLSYVGQGMIMGPRTGWCWLGPMAQAKGWASGDIGSSDDGAKGWLMWVSLAIMLGESFVSLSILAIRSCCVALTVSGSAGTDPDPAPRTQQVPYLWWTSGLAVSTVLCAAIVAPLFEIPMYMPVVAVFFSIFVSVLNVRALGETDLGPVSGIGKVSQLLFAVVAPGNVVANIIAGAISEAGAMAAGDLMQDLKCGHLVGASPRAQFFGQLIGTFFSIFCSVAAWTLYSSAYEIPGEQFPAPTAILWLDMAELVNGGSVATNVLPTCIGAASCVALLPLAELLAPCLHLGSGVEGAAKVRERLPSGIAIAIGMYVTPNWTIPRVIGGFANYLWRRLAPEHARRYMIVLASGFVLGEGVISIVTAVLQSFGIGIASCWGCPEPAISGFCGGCYDAGGGRL